MNENKLLGAADESAHDNIVRNEDGSVKSHMVRLPGQDRSFRCECGCNCFHKRIGEPTRYICNSCEVEYVGS